ncbi:MAG: tetratricopeptide repeat protein [Micropepsaceae bacterium]
MGLRLNRALLRSASRIALAAGAAAFLSGCTGTGFFGSGQPQANAAAIAALEKADNQDYAAAAAYWGAKYEANRGDMTAALNFARNLRLMGGARQGVAVLREVVMKAPDNPKISSEYGKALTAVGRSHDAIPFLARATQMDSSDWTTFSAYGVALDQTGGHDAARQNYETALKLSPDNATIESNMAMSYILTGNVDRAETILRRLVSRPDATPQMRQNLAMVASLKGNTAEAAQLASEDLPATQATNNLAVLRQLDASNAEVSTSPATTEPELTKPVASAPITEKTEVAATEGTVETVAETSIPETAPIVTAAPAPVAAATEQTRYQMAPVADDAQLPASIVPKAQKTEAAKPATQKQSSMLRKSVAIANVAD